jgi:hypothetical protein
MSPRPRVAVGAALTLIGAVLAILGTYLPWWTASTGETFDGYATFIVEGDAGTTAELYAAGLMVWIGAMFTAGLAVTMLTVGRHLILAIPALVLAVLGVLGGLLFAFAVNDAAVVGEGPPEEFVRRFVGEAGSANFGVYVPLLGALISLIGSVVVLTKRRRPVQSAYLSPGMSNG